MYQIRQRQAFSDTAFLWEIEAPDIARAAQPGHFVMLRLYEGGERIPLTVADFDPIRGTITLVVQALGKTTREMRDGYGVGDTFLDFVGPLGLPQHIGCFGHVVLVGGGLGVAPVFPQLRAFKEAGNRTTAIMGFRSRAMVFWEERLQRYSDELIVCTDDGSYGTPGFVSGALKTLLEREQPALVVAIGPLPMMQACAETTRPFGVKTIVSLNTIMVDGTGMCGSCRVTVDGKVKFACVDGPDFDGHLVDFKELHARQKRFKSQEQRATEAQNHVCNLNQKLFVDGKRSYKKLAELEPHQVRMPERNPEERAKNFKEVNLGYSMNEAIREAERCIQCLKPTCIAGCPVSIDIPRFIRHLLVRDLEHALETIYESSLFPSICGRVCPQESQCEAQCVIGRKLEPVAIGRLERFIGDNAVPPLARAPQGPLKLGRVAIVGSGPAGLAAAADLVRFGAEVTVYEALHVLGGVLQYGIPAFRLPRNIINREIQRLKDIGVRFETNKVIGKTFTVSQLMQNKGFDAVFIAAGAGAPSFLGIPGEFAGQVYSANEFLTRVNLMGGDRFPLLDTPIALGQSVVVIGAGNTAMDCLRVAKRLGAPTVRCVYRRSEAEAPARLEELRHAKEEGIEFFFLHGPVAIKVDDNGDVRGMTVQRMTLGEPDARGRRKPEPIPGALVDLDCDTVIYALGTNANPVVPQTTPGLALNPWGHILADDQTQATNLPGVFAGGDIVTGGATVILAMGAGRRAAKAIGLYLQQNKQQWPPGAAAAAAFQPRSALEQASLERATLGQATLGQATLGQATLGQATLGQAAPGQCPRCQQPVADGESYICCADAAVSWKCRCCGKVSEGFAFPYGGCPYCGGALEMLKPRHFDETETALAAIRTAFEIELGGQAFYHRAARESADPLLKDLFSRLADMEQAHMATLSRRYHAQVPAPGEQFRLEQAALFAGIGPRLDGPDGLFQIAIAFEQRAVAFFEEHGAKTAAASPEQQLYQELAAEEREHVAVLTTEYQRWRANKPGLL